MILDVTQDSNVTNMKSICAHTKDLLKDRKEYCNLVSPSISPICRRT